MTNNISKSVAEQMRAITVPDYVSSDDGKEIVSAVLNLLFDIGVEGDLETAFDDWKDGIGEAWCRASGCHTWIHDHCGFWGHQYCAWCRSAKYPEIPSSCADCRELMAMTEDKYISINPVKVPGREYDS